MVPRRRAAWAASLLALLMAAAPVRGHDHGTPDGTPPRLLPGLGDHHHAIATGNAEAQRYFDQGLTLVFAFNHDEAVRSFAHAAALDPRAAMPLWGVALALGPNINMDVDPARERAAYEAVERARALARRAPEHERAYVEALARRYSTDPGADLKALAVRYEEAMAEVARRYPDDLDAATLYAESAMDLRPWQLWAADGSPAAGTEEIVATLESVLRRDPNHVGANHYYIHAVEASPRPERALPSAARLEYLVPGAGHLVHMPAHVYMRTGDFAAAARANERAIEADRTYLAGVPDGGMYSLMYADHNFHFLAFAYAMAGRHADAKRTADAMVANVSPLLAGLPPEVLAMIDVYIATPLSVDLRFHRWDEIVGAPEPEARFPVAHALWHFARGSAFAATGRMTQAETERRALADAGRELRPDATFGQNDAHRILALAGTVLDARLAEARGRTAEAIAQWTRAIAAEDGLAYNEPSDWYYPVRESLGAALLRARRPAEAEAVFRADLERNPRNGRSLFGLVESLEAQGRSADRAWAEDAFARAWRDAEVPLRARDL